MVCPNCGNKNKRQFDIKQENDIRDTIIICKKCGKKGTKKLFLNANYNPFTREAEGRFSDQDMKLPSAKTDSINNKNNPEVKHERKTDKKNRSKPESRINPKLDETSNENSRRVSMSNPFVKETVAKKENPFTKKSGRNITIEDLIEFSENPENKLRNLKEETNGNLREIYKEKGLNIGLEESRSRLAKNKNPFTKEADRDFKRTDQQLERKDDKNLVFPEGEQNLEDSGKSVINQDDESSIHGRYRRFDTVDRKEPRNSPDPKDFIPGYKEWFDREVDKYYVGWLKDHIENSGGQVIGSNTEKTMNLNEGERNHPPVHPMETPYEKQLETRHHFNKGETMIAGNNPFAKKADSKKKTKKRKSKARGEWWMTGPNSGLGDVGGAGAAGASTNPFVKKAELITDEISSIIKDVYDKRRHQRKFIIDIIVDSLKITPENANKTIALSLSSSGDASRAREIILRSLFNYFEKYQEAAIENFENGDVFIAGTEDSSFMKKAMDFNFSERTYAKANMLIKKLKEKDMSAVGYIFDILLNFDIDELPERNTLINMVFEGNEDAEKTLFNILSNLFDEEDKQQKKQESGLSVENMKRGKKRVKVKTENEIRTPYCPNEEDENLVHSEGENALYLCPSTKKVFNEEGNNMGLKQPKWKGKKVKK